LGGNGPFLLASANMAEKPDPRLTKFYTVFEPFRLVRVATRWPKRFVKNLRV
jgi:hypothetical protein